MARSKAAEERLELLSSPLPVNNNEEVDVDKVIQKQPSSTPEQSPVRSRDKFLNFFGVSPTRRKQEDEVKEELNEIEAAAEEFDEIENGSCKFDTLTCLNTLKNQYIEAPESLRENEKKLTEASEAVPVSRLFLSMYPEQGDLFKTEIELCKKNMKNYPLNDIWNIWKETSTIHKNIESTTRPSTSESVTNDRAQKVRLYLEKSIGCKEDLKETIVDYRSMFKCSSNYEGFQLHIFKDGIKPKKSSPEVINGGIVAIQVSHSRIYKFWKHIMRVILEEKFINSQNNEVYALKQLICGLSFIVKSVDVKSSNNSATKTGLKTRVLLFKLWILPMMNVKFGKRIPEHRLIINLCHFLHDNLPEDINHCIQTAKYADNRTLKAYKVFSLGS